jgi:TonB-linked SusC/RagA family outer membrane protein
MYLNDCSSHLLKNWSLLNKKLPVLSLTVFMLLTMCINSSAHENAQTITLSEKDVSLEKIFREIKRQSGYTFVYTEKLLQKAAKVSVSITNASLNQALDICFSNQPLTYSILNRMVVIKEKEKLQVNIDPAAPLLGPITGKITNADNEPLEGASITEKGTNNSAITAEDGTFSMNISKSNSVLVISYVGYVTKEINTGGQTSITVSLEQVSSNLNDVVVVGYGTQKRKDLTGAVGSLDSRDIRDQGLIRPDQALLGKVAGVQVKPVSGQPGAAMQIRIRGIGSISAGAEPLYVVDGFPVSDIQTLNPNDIESMDILKDASATAIYGSRGSNGVVLITTRRGKSGTPTLAYDTYFGIQQVSLKPKMMNARQEAQYFYDGVKNRNLDAGNDVSGPADRWRLAVPDIILDVLSGKNTTDVDWLSLIMRKAPVQQHQLSLTGGNQNVKYALSGEYLDQQGIIRKTGFKRYSLRANMDAQVSKRLNVRLNVNPSYTEERIVQASGLTSGPNENVLGSAMAVTPFYPVYDSTGDYFPYNGLAATGNFYHPIALLNEIKNTRNGIRVIANINAEYRIFDALRFNVLIGTDVRSSEQNKFRPRIPAFLNEVAYGSSQTTMNYNWLAEYTLNYTKSFGQHNLSAVAGYTAQRDRLTSTYIYSDKYSNNLVPTLSAVSGIITDGTSTLNQWSMVSYLGRVNYNYLSKYYVTASIRTDGSSRFGNERKFGVFPSAAVAWRISDENFLKNVRFLSEMKLRASYGETGNNNIGNYDHIATAIYEKYILGGAAVGGFAPGRLSNPFLTWEKQQQFNTGVNAGFFNKRLNVSVDYFSSTNTNLLLNVNTPAITGFNSALENIGQVRNTGWEFVVSTTNIQGKFQWSTDMNLSTYRNKVTRLGPSGDPIITIGNITQIGQPIGMFYGWLVDGIFKTQAELAKGPIFAPGTAARSRVGDIRFVDVSGPDGKPDGIINSLDKTIMGTPYPDFYYGMTNHFSYRDVHLSIGLQGSQGASTINKTRVGANISTRARTNQLALSNNYWKSEQDPGDGKTPRPNDAPTGNVRGESSQRELDNASYLRINTITLSYNLPANISKKARLSSARVYISAINPFIFTKYTSFNPDSSNSGNSLTPGIDLNDYPLPKSLLLGFNLTF